jgi:hypothetical protein
MFGGSPIPVIVYAEFEQKSAELLGTGLAGLAQVWQGR